MGSGPPAAGNGAGRERGDIRQMNFLRAVAAKSGQGVYVAQTVAGNFGPLNKAAQASWNKAAAGQGVAARIRQRLDTRVDLPWRMARMKRRAKPGNGCCK